MKESLDSLLDSVNLSSPRSLAALTTDKEYRKIVSFDNCTSYSQQGDLHACPRRYQLIKYDAKHGGSEGIEQLNLDFAFGHSVGAGVQTYLATRDLTSALFAGFISWKADYFADADEQAARFGKRTRKNKNINYASLAVEKFAAQGLADEWEIFVLPSGQPAVEVAFVLDCENGYKHYGHIDLIMRNRNSGKIAVFELKTAGFVDPDEALYANSAQALSYSLVVDAIAPGQSEYDVVYLVYSAPSMEWHSMPFRKSLTQKAEWIQDLLFDQNNIKIYRELKFFPKRGESCRQFNRRCKYFGICDVTSHITYTDLPPARDAENVNFKFTLSEIITAQKGKR